jgi:cytochrome c oxidase subunit 2
MPKQIHGNTALELTWTILPIILLAVIAVPTVDGIRDLARNPGDDALDVKVTGVQWAWLFEYPGIDAGGAPLTTPIGEMRIPVGQEIDLEIHSTDVNHSFWVPKLAGKIDAIQNHTNRMWFEATEPGVYVGQCAEFCGLDHYNMRMTVIAMPPEEFDAWVAEQQAEARQRAAAEELVASSGE